MLNTYIAFSGPQVEELTYVGFQMKSWTSRAPDNWKQKSFRLDFPQSVQHGNFTPDFSDQFLFSWDVREIRIQLYHHKTNEEKRPLY